MNTENNYTETDLGNVAPNPRGEFSEAEEYEYLDYVYYKGGSYLCLAELGTTIVGFSPESGKTTQYWQAVALPGGLTPEYVAMHDRVVNLSEQVEADADEVRESKENIEGMETNVENLQAQAAQSAQEAEESKTQAAGYASAAEASRQAAETSEQNINAQVTGFDTHVAEKTASAESDIEAARIAANAAVVAQQEESVQEVKNKTSQYITEKQTEAEQAVETKAQEYATGVDADIQAVKDAGTTQVGNVNSAGETQVQNVNNAGTTQIEAVNTAGSAQKKAVEDAGQEALNNIGAGVDSSLSQEGKAADAAATGKAVDELKGDLVDIKSDTYIVEKTKNLNNSSCVTGNFLINNDGTIVKFENVFSVVIPIEPNKVITIDNKTTGDRYALTTTNAFPDNGVPHSGLVSFVNGTHYTTPNTAKYLIIYCNQNGAVDISGMRVYYGTEWVEESTTKSDKALSDSSNALSKLSEVFEMVNSISPKQTTFFDINYGSEDNVTFFIGYCDNNGKIVEDSSLSSLIINLKPSKTYYIYIPNRNRGNIVSSPNGEFIVGNTYEKLEYESPFVHNGSYIYKVTTKEDTKAIMLYFYNGVYDYESNKNKIIVSEDEWNPYARIELKKEYLPTFLSDVNPLDNSKILIFGDSITDCCYLSIVDNKTTEYYFRNPSNSYTNSEGQTVSYSMWPKILNDSVNAKEIRNYAHYGASFKTSTRESGLERQNLHYQIDVAMNDLDNPNNVFSVDNFVPDIVIFALGTNDGNPNDTYESAMNVAYYKTDGVTLDTDMIMANLSETKFCESARKAFMRIKKAFPIAQIYCVLPIQRADNEGNTKNLHDELKKIADRYGCIIIDGTFDFGITRDFNNWSSIGMYLKDGLHPNDKGQNLMARGIISSLKSHYIPFGKGFNA